MGSRAQPGPPAPERTNAEIIKWAAGAGIGSAAIVAALLYASRPKPTPAPPTIPPESD